MTLEQAAAHLAIEPEALARLAEQGAVPGRLLGDQWRFSRSGLTAWLAGEAPAPKAAAAAQPPALSDAGLGGVYGTGPEGGVGEEPAQVGYPPEGKTASEIFLRQHQVLLNPGQFIIEPTATYSTAQQREFAALTVGGGITATVYQSTVLEDRVGAAALAVRYGLIRETEVYVGARYRGYHSTQSIEFEDGGTLQPSADPRLGSDSVVDMYFGISRTLLMETGLIPDVILSVEGTAPISNATWQITAKTWLVKSFDPVVVFGGFDYRYAFTEDYDNFNLLVSDNRFRLTAGWAFSVNDSLTLSTSVSGTWTTETEYPTVILPSREDYSLRLGLTNMTRHGVYIEPSVTLGLSGAGNWVAFGLTVPWAVNQ